MYAIETGENDFQGVIAFTPEFVDRLLEVVGPVDVPSAGVTVHPGETYLLSLEQVEVLNQGRGRKQFLAELASIVIDRLFALPPKDYGLVLAAIDESAKRKELQILLDDPSERSALDALGWPGFVDFDDRMDRLAIMETNVAPISKLDVLLTMSHELDVQLHSDGSASERLTTTYTNHFKPKLDPRLERVRQAFFDGNLGHYSRRYISPKALLTAVSSDDPSGPITDAESLEHEPTGLAVGNYLFLRPGRVGLTTHYVVPGVVAPGSDGASGVYRLDFRKQAGRDEDIIRVRVHPPQGAVPTGWSPGGVLRDGTVEFETTTEFDRKFEVSFGSE
jgi:hypothetical protein